MISSSGNKRIDAPGDLREMKLAAIENSAAMEYLDRERIPYRSFSGLSEALKSVAEEEQDAVLHAVPALKYEISNDPDLSLRVQSLKLDPHYYSFSVGVDSPLRKKVNLGLLKILNTALWQQELDRYIPDKN